MNPSSTGSPGPNLEVRGAGASAVIVQRVPADKAARFLELQGGIVQAAQGFPGYQKVDVYPPAKREQVEWVVVIHFDEYIKPGSYNDEIFVSPVQKTPPTVKVSGKNLTITLQDTLRASTTYIINIGKGIKDNNEGNKMAGTIVYATDNEPGVASLDLNLRELAVGADIFINDAQYSPAQLAHERKGWGHSSWSEGVKVARETGVKTLVLFHHDPDSTDRMVDSILKQAREEFDSVFAASEGMVVTLGAPGEGVQAHMPGTRTALRREAHGEQEMTIPGQLCPGQF